MLQPKLQQPRNAAFQQQSSFWYQETKNCELTAQTKAPINLPFQHFKPVKLTTNQR